MMPFITQERRKQIDDKESDIPEMVPGDRCYLFYKEMVRRWKEKPRWTTAHEIYKELLLKDRGKFVVYDEIEGHIKRDLDDDYVAQNLSWQVFFQLYVMPYELKKRKENGDI
jgi:hypothetical protein